MAFITGILLDWFYADCRAFDVEAFARIRKAGLDLEPPRARVEGEGRSIYFYDHDNHLFELHTGTLKERLGRYEGEPQNPMPGSPDT